MKVSITSLGVSGDYRRWRLEVEHDGRHGSSVVQFGGLALKVSKDLPAVALYEVVKASRALERDMDLRKSMVWDHCEAQLRGLAKEMLA